MVQFGSIKKKIKNNLKSRERSDKIMESYLDSNKVFNSLFKAVNQYYGLIHINLSPQIIENLEVITGNDTYTLYDLNNFFSNVSTDTRNIDC